MKTKTQFIFIFQAKQSYGLFRKWYQGLSRYVQGTENVVQLLGSTDYAGEISKQYKKLKNTAKISLDRDDQDFTVTYKSTNCDKELLPSRKIMFKSICYCCSLYKLFPKFLYLYRVAGKNGPPYQFTHFKLYL